MPKTPILSLIALGVSAGVAGFVLARTSDPVAGSAHPDLGQGRTKLSALTPSTGTQELAADAAKIAAIDDADSLLKLLETLGDDTRGQIGRQRVFERLAEVDPERAFVALRDDWANLNPFMIEWAAIDPQVTARRMIEAKMTGFNTVAWSLALREPERCLELIATWEEEAPRPDWTGAIATRIAFSRICSEDSQKAMALLEKVSQRQRADALAGIAKGMAEADVVAARSWAEALKDRDERDAAVGAVAAVLGKTDPDAAVPLLKNLRDPIDRRDGYRGGGGIILRRMISEDPAAAMAWADRNFNDSSWTRAIVILSLWGGNVSETVALIDAAPDERSRNILIGSISGDSHKPDARGILDAADDLESESWRTRLRSGMMSEYARADLAAAISYMESLPADEVDGAMWDRVFEGGKWGGFDGQEELFWENIGRVPIDQQAKYLHSPIRRLALSDPDAATAKLLEYRDHPGYGEILGGMARDLQKSDPAAARSLVEGLEGDNLGSAAISYIGYSAGGAAGQTFEWLRTLPIGDEQMVEAASKLTRAWTRDDPISASAAIAELPEGATRDGAIIGLASASYSTDPATALEWIDEISDETVRKDLQKRAERELQRSARLEELQP